MNELPVFDKEGTLDRVDSDIELLHELFDIYLEERDGMLAQIQEGVEQENASKLEKSAHAAKSALGNLGAMRCQALCFELEKLGRAGSLEGAKEKYDELVSEVAHFDKAIEAERTSD